jgi:hypothetical protein
MRSIRQVAQLAGLVLAIFVIVPLGQLVEGEPHRDFRKAG